MGREKGGPGPKYWLHFRLPNTLGFDQETHVRDLDGISDPGCSFLPLPWDEYMEEASLALTDYDQDVWNSCDYLGWCDVVRMSEYVEIG